MSNYFRTALLLAALTAIFMGGGLLLAGTGGMLIALVVAAVMNIFAWWNSGSAVLRYYRARELNDPTHPLYRIVAQLADRDGLPLPRVYIIDNHQPNAFATGRGPQNAAVAATSGLLQMMNEREVAGVMAHELAHVKNRDTLIMTITATFAGALSMLANFALFFGGNRNSPFGLVGTLAMMILAPLAAMLVQMAISRTREYQADREGAEICGHPDWLADALEKLEAGASRTANQAADTIRPPRTCSSSTLCTPTSMTACSRPTRTPRTGWRVYGKCLETLNLLGPSTHNRCPAPGLGQTPITTVLGRENDEKPPKSGETVDRLSTYCISYYILWACPHIPA